MMLREAIYKGATRPAMKFGVPLVPLVLLAGAGLLASVWGGLLLSGWMVLVVIAAVVPTLAWMRHATRGDDQRFKQIALRVQLDRHGRNRSFWQARSYAPTLYRGAQDGRAA